MPVARETISAISSAPTCVRNNLGLPPDSAFWSDPDALYSSQMIYSGLDVAADSALKE